MKRYLLLTLLVLLSGCVRQPLVVYTDYINREDLASFHVGTPDPALNYPDVGQRLLIYWSLPFEYHEREDLTLVYTVRFRNHAEICEGFPLCKKSGCTIYFLKNEAYFETEGIATFKVEIWDSDDVIYEWVHPLWVDLIEIGESCASSSTSE